MPLGIGFVMVPHVAVNWIASKLRKTDETGEAYSNDPPTHGALTQFFQKVDWDSDYFPGKHSGTKRGPPPTVTPAKRARIIQSGMSQKDEGEEPSPDVTVITHPMSTYNPKTKQAFCGKTIRKIWLKHCYDFTPEFPWKYQYPLQRRFLPEDTKEHRLTMTNHILEQEEHGDSVQWWAQNVLWFDPCASILPTTRRQYVRMRQAELGNKKRLISDDAKEYSRNMRGAKESLKQAGFESMRISWLMVLARGKVAIEMLPEGWTVDSKGVAHATRLLPRILRRMLGEGAPLPRVLFTDRGTGMYTPNGHICRAYGNAVKAAGFRTYWGANASMQSADMGDLLLHETAVAWLRNRMRRERPVVLPWSETRAQWADRAARCERYINENYDAPGLCRRFPSRLRTCREREGDRIPK